MVKDLKITESFIRELKKHLETRKLNFNWYTDSKITLVEAKSSENNNHYYGYIDNGYYKLFISGDCFRRYKKSNFTLIAEKTIFVKDINTPNNNLLKTTR